LLPDALIEALRDAQHVCVLTGAGISAESGIPTFREAQTGLWEHYDPMDLATPEAFLRDPELVWRWYRWRRDLVAEANPNPGHRALAELENLVPSLTLVTQNVDGLHTRAGSAEIVEFHGNLFETRCFVEGCVIEVSAAEGVPSCPACGSHARPGVVWFGEAIPPQALDRAFAAARNCDLFLSIGTSSLVYPAAGLAELAKNHGAIVAEINPHPTGLAANFDHAVAGNAGEVLPELVARLRGS
jgi:NAD-dependent deacetylase